MKGWLVIASIVLMGLLIYFSPQISLYIQKFYGYFSPKREVAPQERRQAVIERGWANLVRNASGEVLFDQSHENGFAVIGENATYSHFASMFLEAGYRVEIARDEHELKEKLRHAKVLIITNPLQNYSAMRDEIVSFVGGGGILMLIGDVDRKAVSNLNEISIEFGLIFNNDYIYDLYNYSWLYNNPIISDFVEHEITSHLKAFVVYEACSLKVFGEARPLAYGGKNAKSTLGFQELVVLAVGKYRKGKIVGICDGNLWTNEALESFDNKNLLINIINWTVANQD